MPDSVATRAPVGRSPNGSAHPCSLLPCSPIPCSGSDGGRPSGRGGVTAGGSVLQQLHASSLHGAGVLSSDASKERTISGRQRGGRAKQEHTAGNTKQAPKGQHIGPHFFPFFLPPFAAAAAALLTGASPVPAATSAPSPSAMNPSYLDISRCRWGGRIQDLGREGNA